jgi:hypothetical protein
MLKTSSKYTGQDLKIHLKRIVLFLCVCRQQNVLWIQVGFFSPCNCAPLHSLSPHISLSFCVSVSLSFSLSLNLSLSMFLLVSLFFRQKACMNWLAGTAVERKTSTNNFKRIISPAVLKLLIPKLSAIFVLISRKLSKVQFLWSPIFNNFFLNGTSIAS